MEKYKILKENKLLSMSSNYRIL